MDVRDRMQTMLLEIPAPPPGDPEATYRRGRRRATRRWLVMGGGATASAIVGLALLVPGTPLEVPPVAGVPDARTEAATPAGEDLVVTGPSEVTVGSSDPFEWVVAMAPTDGPQWCTVARFDTTHLDIAVGQDCIDIGGIPSPATHDGQGLMADFGAGHVEFTEADGNTRQIVWGWVVEEADEVLVGFTDGTVRSAEVAGDASGGQRLWAIAHHMDVEHAVVEVRSGGRVLDEPR